MGESPELTIAIATRDRPELLADVLRSCAGQRLDGRLFEILVVCDGESDGTDVVCQAFSRTVAELRPDLVFRVVEPWREGRGLAAARNVCAAEARGRYIRFQDDDDVVDPYAADALLNAHYGLGPAAAVLGYTGIAAHLLDLPIMRYLGCVGGEMFNYRDVPDGPLGFDWFWGGRTSVASRLARSVGFDEELKFGAEDIEFAFRAAQTDGLSVTYAPSVRSSMIRPLDMASFTRRCHRQGQAARYVAAKYPHSALEQWAVVSHAYTSWTGDGGLAFGRAFQRCRRLELMLDFFRQTGVVSVAKRRLLDAAYRETFGLAKALGFAGTDQVPVG
jgi:glycosyltransferase involved in cell wall biosynthesis